MASENDDTKVETYRLPLICSNNINGFTHWIQQQNENENIVR